MFALFEEAGKFQAGRVLSEAEASSQIELESGKRVKVKAANVLLKFDKPTPSDLIRQAQALAEGIELELAYYHAAVANVIRALDAAGLDSTVFEMEEWDF